MDKAQQARIDRIAELNAEYDKLSERQTKVTALLRKINQLMEKLNRKRTRLWSEHDRNEKEMRRLAGQVWQIVADSEDKTVWDQRRKSQSPHM